MRMRKEESVATYSSYVRGDLSYRDPRHLQYKKRDLVLTYVKPGRALIDIGCGTGEFVCKLKDRFEELVGIDPDPFAIEFSRNRLGEEKKIAFYQQELGSLGFPTEHFDVCLCLDVLEHIQDLNPLLDEIRRILKPGGEMIVSVPNWYDILYAKILRRNPNHVHTLPPWMWVKAFRRAGFSVSSYRAVDFPVFKSDFLSRKIPILGMCIVMRAVR